MSSFKKAAKCNQKTHRERAQVRIVRDNYVDGLVSQCLAACGKRLSLQYSCPYILPSGCAMGNPVFTLILTFTLTMALTLTSLCHTKCRGNGKNCPVFNKVHITPTTRSVRVCLCAVMSTPVTS